MGDWLYCTVLYCNEFPAEFGDTVLYCRFQTTVVLYSTVIVILSRCDTVLYSTVLCSTVQYRRIKSMKEVIASMLSVSWIVF